MGFYTFHVGCLPGFQLLTNHERDMNHLDVSKNRGTPKWMVYTGKHIKMDALGVPLFLETPI